MTVFLILYECTWFSSIVPPVYFAFELVLPVNEGESVRGGTASVHRQKGRLLPWRQEVFFCSLVRSLFSAKFWRDYACQKACAQYADFGSPAYELFSNF